MNFFRRYKVFIAQLLFVLVMPQLMKGMDAVAARLGDAAATEEAAAAAKKATQEAVAATAKKGGTVASTLSTTLRAALQNAGKVEKDLITELNSAISKAETSIPGQATDAFNKMVQQIPGIADADKATLQVAFTAYGKASSDAYSANAFLTEYNKLKDTNPALARQLAAQYETQTGKSVAELEADASRATAAQAQAKAAIQDAASEAQKVAAATQFGSKIADALTAMEAANKTFATDQANKLASVISSVKAAATAPGDAAAANEFLNFVTTHNPELVDSFNASRTASAQASLATQADAGIASLTTGVSPAGAARIRAAVRPPGLPDSATAATAAANAKAAYTKAEGDVAAAAKAAEEANPTLWAKIKAKKWWILGGVGVTVLVIVILVKVLGGGGGSSSPSSADLAALTTLLQTNCYDTTQITSAQLAGILAQINKDGLNVNSGLTAAQVATEIGNYNGANGTNITATVTPPSGQSTCPTTSGSGSSSGSGSTTYTAAQLTQMQTNLTNAGYPTTGFTQTDLQTLAAGLASELSVTAPTDSNPITATSTDIQGALNAVGYTTANYSSAEAALVGFLGAVYTALSLTPASNSVVNNPTYNGTGSSSGSGTGTGTGTSTVNITAMQSNLTAAGFSTTGWSQTDLQTLASTLQMYGDPTTMSAANMQSYIGGTTQTALLQFLQICYQISGTTPASTSILVTSGTVAPTPPASGTTPAPTNTTTTATTTTTASTFDPNAVLANLAAQGYDTAGLATSDATTIGNALVAAGLNPTTATMAQMEPILGTDLIMYLIGAPTMA